MKTLYDTAKQALADEMIRTGQKFQIPQSMQPQIMKLLSSRLQTKKKITKSDLKHALQYIQHVRDLKTYPKRFFDTNFYGFPLELMKGFTHFIDYVYEKRILQRFLTSKKLFRNFEFNNDPDFYDFISTPIQLHFYIVLLKYKSKMFLMLYDTESHHLHFAQPISRDY